MPKEQRLGKWQINTAEVTANPGILALEPVFPASTGLESLHVAIFFIAPNRVSGQPLLYRKQKVKILLFQAGKKKGAVTGSSNNVCHREED